MTEHIILVIEDKMPSPQVIVAAPTLLAQLRWAVVVVEQMIRSQEPGDYRTGLEAGLANCRAAIERADPRFEP